MPITISAESPASVDLSPRREALQRFDPVRLNGKVVQVIGLVIESVGPAAMIGEVCEIFIDRSRPPVLAEVVGFRESRVLLMPLDVMEGIKPGSEVVSTRAPMQVVAGPE